MEVVPFAWRQILSSAVGRPGSVSGLQINRKKGL